MRSNISFITIMSWRNRFNHILHKYDWRHVIDTIIHLHMIVGLGIKLNSMLVRSWRWTLLCWPRKPCIAAMVLLRKANLSFVHKENCKPAIKTALFFLLRHFCDFLMWQFGHWNVSVICPTVVLKLAITAFFSLYFQTFWPKWLNFFQSFQNHFHLSLKKTQMQCGGSQNIMKRQGTFCPTKYFTFDLTTKNLQPPTKKFFSSAI